MANITRTCRVDDEHVVHAAGGEVVRELLDLVAGEEEGVKSKVTRLVHVVNVLEGKVRKGNRQIECIL